LKKGGAVGNENYQRKKVPKVERKNFVRASVRKETQVSSSLAKIGSTEGVFEPNEEKQGEMITVRSIFLEKGLSRQWK
jgi:hypothetical protein